MAFICHVTVCIDVVIVVVTCTETRENTGKTPHLHASLENGVSQLMSISCDVFLERFPSPEAVFCPGYNELSAAATSTVFIRS